MVFLRERGRGEAETGPVESTVDPADIRALGTNVLMSVRCLPRSGSEGRRLPLRNALEGLAPQGLLLFAHPAMNHEGVVRSCHDRDLACDGPQEG
jgi:hypothetical protein